MRVLCLSDLHLNLMGAKSVKDLVESLNKDVDVCILAGDITGVSMMADHYRLFSERYKDVIVVLGNHDYWGFTINAPIGAAREIAAKLGNVHILQNNTIEIQSKRFIGATLWFPETLESEFGARSWIDFHKLVQGRRQVYRENLNTKTFLHKNVKPGDFVVTHHLPSWNCVHYNWRDADTNCYYVGDADKIILDCQPGFWLFGHTHNSIDMVLDNTRMICNPRGYQFKNGIENIKFNPNLIVEY